MFEPSATSPITLSGEQQEALRGYFDNCLENGRTSRSHPLEFALVLAGDKPAATMHPTEDEFPNDPFDPAAGLRRLCDVLNVVCRKPRTNWWFVAPVDGRLDLLPSGNRTERNEAWYRRFGVVLGYPPDAIEAFIDARGQWTEPHELVADGHFDADTIADAGFVSYRHDDSIDGYEQAIEQGRALRRRLDELADTWGVPEIDEFVEAHRSYLCERAQPEKAAP